MTSPIGPPAPADDDRWTDAFFDRQYVDLLSEQMGPVPTARQVRFLRAVLELPRGARVLDVGCGFGRHAGALARAGYEVVGMDSSRAMISEARLRWRGVSRVRFLRARMQSLSFRSEFDAAICMFTSFGYLSPKENRRTLAAIVRAVKPGGRIVVDTRDLDEVKRTLARSQWWTFGRSFRVHENATLDPSTGVLRNRWWIVNRKTGKRSRRVMRVQFSTRAKWKTMLRVSGARLRAFYSDFTPASRNRRNGPRLLVVAESLSKPAKASPSVRPAAPRRAERRT